MKKIFIAVISLLVFCNVCAAAEFKPFDSPVRAEIISEKAFVRADHDHDAKRVITLEEGDSLFLTGEWNDEEPYPWYAVTTKEEKGWIYGQNIQRLDGKPAAPTQTAAAPAEQERGGPITLDAGVVSSDGDYVTVIARGQGTDRQKALEQAWIEAVRLAVGTVISSRSELNNDEFAENTIAHSRGVVESFDIVGEQSDDKRLTITIQAKVRKETLIEVAKTYGEEQTVKADTGEAVKTLLDDKAQESSNELVKKTGQELLKEVLESYPPEIFYSAALDPKIYLDGDKKPYVNITQTFNEDLFWKEFLPKLRTALEGVAVKKEKRKYESSVQQANRKLETERYAQMAGIYDDLFFRNKYDAEIFYNTIAPYSLAEKNDKEVIPQFLFQQLRSQYIDESLPIIIPENNTEYTVYYLQCKIFFEKPWDFVSDEMTINSSAGKVYKLQTQRYDTNWKRTESSDQPYFLFSDYVRKGALPLEFSITYADGDGYDIHNQIIQMGPVMSVVYGNFFRTRQRMPQAEILNPIRTAFALAPGFVNGNVNDPIYRPSFDFFLDTTKSPKNYPVVLDEEDLQKVDSMRFEYIFEKIN